MMVAQIKNNEASNEDLNLQPINREAVVLSTCCQSKSDFNPIRVKLKTSNLVFLTTL